MSSGRKVTVPATRMETQSEICSSLRAGCDNACAVNGYISRADLQTVLGPGHLSAVHLNTAEIRVRLRVFALSCSCASFNKFGPGRKHHVERLGAKSATGEASS